MWVNAQSGRDRNDTQYGVVSQNNASDGRTSDIEGQTEILTGSRMGVWQRKEINGFVRNAECSWYLSGVVQAG